MQTKKKTKTPAKPTSPLKGLALPRSPKITAKPKTKHITSADLRTCQDTSMALVLDLKLQTPESYAALEIEQDQQFFPYTVGTRLFVGWDAVHMISSFEMKITSDYPLPRLTVRFVEKMTPDEVAQLDPNVRATIMGHIAKLQQFPFVTVESPLLVAPPAPKA